MALLLGHGGTLILPARNSIGALLLVHLLLDLLLKGEADCPLAVPNQIISLDDICHLSLDFTLSALLID